MDIFEITGADDLAALAKEALDRLWKEKRFGDLMSALLMANHVADWHFKVDLGRDRIDIIAMKTAYPEWNTIREIANGTKHCKPKAGAEVKLDEVQWEHDDFWGSPAQAGNDGRDWFVEHESKQRSVAVLIKNFLQKFETASTRPT
jgi:hypothetical protein